VPASSTAARLPLLVGLVVSGVVLGLVGVGVIALTSTVGSVTLPWGLALAVAGVVTSVRGAAWLVGDRSGAVAVLLGWFVPTLAFSAWNPGGDVVLTDEPRTYVYLLTTFALGLLAATWPLPAGAAEAAAPRPRPRADDEIDGDGEHDAGWYDAVEPGTRGPDLAPGAAADGVVERD
jgi:hypothetical protein